MPTPRVVKSLSNMEFDEISLVDRSANQHADVAISKRAPEEDQMPELYHEDGTLLDETNAYEGATVYDEDDNPYVLEASDDTESGDDEGDDVSKALWSAGSGGTTRVAGNALEHVAGGGKNHRLGNAARRGGARAQRGAKAVAGNRGAQLAGAGAAGAVGGSQVKKSFSETVLEDISKAFTDEDRDQIISKALEALEQENQEAYQIAKSERDLRLEREYIAKADTYGLPIDSAELGPVLYRVVETMAPADAAVIAKALEAAGELSGSFFDEIGQQGGGSNGDVMQAVDAMAGDVVSKADGDMDISKAQAITGVFDSNPDAYGDYLRDRRGF